MFDTRLLTLLEDPDVERRKQAIKALAQSKDRDVLEHLQDVELYDEDDAVRLLAAKAGAYIRRHVPAAKNASPLHDDPLTGPGITPTQRRRERNGDAFAGTVDSFTPAGGAMFDRANAGQVIRRGRLTLEPVEVGVLALVVLGALLMIVSFVFMNWFEQNNFIFSSPSLLVNGGELTGLDVFSEQIQGDLDMFTGYSNYSTLLDNLYYLTGFVLLAAVIQLGWAGFVLATQQRPPAIFWTQMLVLGLLALGAFGWSYYDLLPFDQRLDDFGLPGPADYLGMGYWLGLAGTLGVVMGGVFGQFYLNNTK